MNPEHNNKTDRILYLLTAHLNGFITADEQAELNQWLNSSEQNKKFLEEISADGFADNLLKDWAPAQAEKSLKRVKKQLGHSKTYPLWLPLAGAAMVLVFLGLWFFADKSPLKHAEVQASQQADIAPGKVGATLTLSNGKKIRLGDSANGELAEDAGMVITKTAGGQLVYEIKSNNTNDAGKLNVLSTTKGETYQIRLPDGSMVWLNAASSLTYAANFNTAKTRNVKLQGEAYFEIAKDKLHPFVVENRGQKVEVLGTHFNVNGYADESEVVTTLLEGSVKVTAGASKKVIKPGQQAALSATGGIQVSAVDTAGAIAWKNGFFMFNKADLPTVMRQLSRWYNIDVKYEGEIPGAVFEGKVYRNLNLSNALELLRYANVKYKVQDKTITIIN